MKTVPNQSDPVPADLIASPMGLIDPTDFTSQSGAAIEDDDKSLDEKDLDDEPLDEDGDPADVSA